MRRNAKWLSACLAAGAVMQFTVACEPYAGGLGSYPIYGYGYGYDGYGYGSPAYVDEYYYGETYVDPGCCGGGYWDGWWW
ncbi:hypothetical protein RAS1_35670 [Phycisphaerae bacterium RAS1]|nr:hypothetical protein RAS1_35670 [Phycisphaerae bacterium RAS1]